MSPKYSSCHYIAQEQVTSDASEQRARRRDVYDVQLEGDVWTYMMYRRMNVNDVQGDIRTYIIIRQVNTQYRMRTRKPRECNIIAIFRKKYVACKM